MKKWISIVVSLGIMLWMAIFFGCFAFSTQQANTPHREALLKVFDDVDVGDTYGEVLEAYWTNRSERLNLITEYPKEWVVKTPFILGAGNWTLRIEFTDGLVRRVAVRTLDGPSPNDGPPDKESQPPAARYLRFADESQKHEP